MGSHDTDEKYIVYIAFKFFANILAWWWPAQAETSRHYLN